MRFTAKTRIYITAEATTKSLSFKIKEAQFDDLSFEPVGNYYVNNIDLASYRATKVLNKIVGSQTFGTGFPTVARESPKARVDTNWIFYYDSSHIGITPSFETAWFGYPHLLIWPFCLYHTFIIILFLIIIQTWEQSDRYVARNKLPKKKGKTRKKISKNHLSPIPLLQVLRFCTITKHKTNPNQIPSQSKKISKIMNPKRHPQTINQPLSITPTK